MLPKECPWDREGKRITSFSFAFSSDIALHFCPLSNTSFLYSSSLYIVCTQRHGGQVSRALTKEAQNQLLSLFFNVSSIFTNSQFEAMQ